MRLRVQEQDCTPEMEHPPDFQSFTKKGETMPFGFRMVNGELDHIEILVQQQLAFTAQAL